MKNLLSIIALAVVATSRAAFVNMASESFVTNHVANKISQLSNYVDTVVAESGPRKTVAMFIIPVNDLPGTNGPYCCVELKCSTNNYENTLFYTATAWFSDNHGDGSTLLLLNRSGQYDKRKYWRAPESLGDFGLATLVNDSKSIVILVDASKMRRSDGGWLYEFNEDAAWTWARGTWGGKEKNPDGTVLWRPIVPVRWFSKMPTWSEWSE